GRVECVQFEQARKSAFAGALGVGETAGLHERCATGPADVPAGRYRHMRWVFGPASDCRPMARAGTVVGELRVMLIVSDRSRAIAWFSLLRDSRTMRIDEVLAAAVEPARRAILESAGPTEVGDHLGARSEGEHLVVHLFGSRLPGYRGWYWAVSVSRAPASSH